MRLAPIALVLAAAALAACNSGSGSCCRPCAPCRPPCYAPAPVPALPGPGTVTADEGWSEPEGEMDAMLPRFTPGLAAGSGSPVMAKFRGTDRKAAKTHVADAPMTSYSSVSALVTELHSQHTDDAMRSRQPTISKAGTSDRIDEEKKNVSVDGWLFAYKFEADQDWHLIVGSASTAPGNTYMNCEVSGLPATSATSYAALLSARQGLDAIFDNHPTTGSSYVKPSPPIHVHVEGSLFYDIDHPPGVVGPTGMRPDTAWEIHPVTKIERIQ